MIRHLLTSALIVAGTIALAPGAFAQTADIPFTGTVSGSCTFGQVTPGTLGVNSPTNPTTLASGFNGGALGKVSVTCNQAAKVVMSQPVQTGGPTFTPVNGTPSGNLHIAGSNSYYAINTPMTLPSNNSPVPLEVDIVADKGSTLAPGTYSYKTTLTITP